METPRLSVIIPTYNRANILEKTLDALLCGQRGEIPSWEIVVVDDGSTDGTPELLRKKTSEFPHLLRAYRQGNLKQGAARNAAMSRAQGNLFVFLGDDIIPSPVFLFRHWHAYQILGEPQRHALIGQTRWHADIPSSPFRTWIGEWGLQFGFRLIQDPENVPFNFFYTSNVSFSRDLYDDFGGFDENFREYGWEDIELGYRYTRLGGMRLRYDPQALAYHHHHITVRSFCDRQRRVGFSAVHFARLHPELKSFLHCDVHVPFESWIQLVGKPLSVALEWCDERLGWLPMRLTERLMQACYAEGMARARGRQEDSRENPCSR